MAGQTRIDGNLIDTGTDPNDIVSVSVGDARYPRLSQDNTLAGNLTVSGQVRSDNVTDSAGTGAPAFPNGGSVTGAALTDPEITGGIYLGGTGSANYLDDYEEGTWTPSVTDTLGFVGSPVDVRGASYIKIGNLVQISFRFFLFGSSGNVSKTDRITIGGFPFSLVSTVQGPPVISYKRTNSQAASFVGSFTGNNAMQIVCVAISTTTSRNGGGFQGSFVYETDS